MANIASAIRATRQIERRSARNLKVKNQVKKALKAGRIGARDLRDTYSTLDRAAKTNVIHWRAAARLKSRLARHLAKTAPQKKSTRSQPRKKH